MVIDHGLFQVVFQLQKISRPSMTSGFQEKKVANIADGLFFKEKFQVVRDILQDFIQGRQLNMQGELKY